MVTPKNSLNLLFAMKSLPSDIYEFKSNEAIWGYGQFKNSAAITNTHPGHLSSIFLLTHDDRNVIN